MRWLEARVPAASAQSLAVFRIVFGGALLAYVLSNPVDAEWIHLAVPESVFHRMALQLYTSAPPIADWIQPWLLCWTTLFMAGAMARMSFAMMTAGVVAWGLLYTMRVGAHSVQILLVVMPCLLVSRWGDAWSVDGWLRRRRASDPAGTGMPLPYGRVYGYSMWVPGLVIGVSYAAAALAKLREGGLGWITNGTVKYHFLSDSPQAPLDWGLQVAQHEGLAVLLSFVAIAIEGLVLVGVCSVRYRYRLAAGVATLALLAGFKVFQGIFWPAWAMMLLSFLPWHVIGASTPPREAVPETPAPRSALRWAQAAIVLLVAGQQVVASALRLEAAPFISAYDMYSSTYTSPADYEAKAGMTYWIVAGRIDGTAEPCKVSRADAELVAAPRAGAALAESDGAMRIIEHCFRAGPSIRTLSIEGRRRSVDWARWRFGADVSVPLAGPVPLEPIR